MMLLEKREDAVSLTHLSATELAAGIREGRFSAVEVVDAHIRRIEAVGGDLNAVVIRLFDEARQEAGAADDALRRGKTVGPLHGVPITIKEQYRVAGLRIGTYTDNDYFPAAPALRRAVSEAAQALEALGASVVPFNPPDAAEAVRIFLGAASANGGADFFRLLGDEKPIPQVEGMFQSASIPTLVKPLVPKLMRARGQGYVADLIDSTGAISAEAYWETVEARTAYRARFVQSLEAGGVDAILCPPAAIPAPTHGSTQHLFPAMTYGLVYNVIGAPAGVVAATTVQPGEESGRAVGRDQAEITAREVEEDSAGLPVGVQVVSRHWREDVALTVMAALESHFRRQPGYPALPV